MISVLVRNRSAWRKKEEEANESEKEENEQMSSISRLESISSFACLLSIVSLPDFFSALSSQYFATSHSSGTKKYQSSYSRMDSYTLSTAQGSYTAIAAQIHLSLKARKKSFAPLQKNSEEKKEFRLDSQ